MVRSIVVGPTHTTRVLNDGLDPVKKKYIYYVKYYFTSFVKKNIKKIFFLFITY